MKNYLLLVSFCLLATLASGQVTREDMFPKNAKYFIKDGNEVPYEKIDSVIISWGGKFGKMRKTVPGEEIIYLIPPKSTIEDQEKKLTSKSNGMVGKPAPEFELTDIHGKLYRLNDLKGKIVVLNFWFTSCVPCIAEMPGLNELKGKYKHREVVFLGLASDSKDRIIDFLKKHSFEYILLLGSTNIAEAYGISIYPTSIIIDRSGTIRYAQSTGEDIKELLSKEIDKVL